MTKKDSQSHIYKTRKGLTIVETLIYMALFSILFTTILGYVIFISQSNANATTRLGLQKQIIFLSEHIASTFKESSSIDILNSTFNSDTGKIRFIEGSSYLEYSITSEKIKVNIGGVNTFLTDSTAKVDIFRVERVNSESGSIIGARVKILLSDKKNASQHSTLETMYTIGS
jgi:hypothetical protein